MTAAAWRIWEVKRGKLHSFRTGDAWDDSYVEATCGRGGCTPPGHACVCGIYATRDVLSAFKLHRLHRPTMRPDQLAAIGEIRLHNPIATDIPVELRGSAATVTRLWVPHRWAGFNVDGIVEKMQRRYSVPCGSDFPPPLEDVQRLLELTS